MHLSVTEGKTQVWCSRGRKGVRVRVGEAMVELSDQFKIVGVVIAAASEKEATKRHLAGRVEKAVMSGRRLEAMAVPPWMKAHLWRAVVLPQALYGCEVRNVKVAPKQLGRVVAVGKRVLRGSLKLASWGAPELLMSQALGEVGFRDPLMEVRCRQARWLVEMANGQDLVGRLHRALAMRTEAGSRWQEPCEAVRAAVEDLGWRVEVNWGARGVSRASWPTIAPEPPPLNAEVVLRPRDGPLSQGAWFTDGSVGHRGGGAAAVEVGTGNVETRFVPEARSSTQPELVGIRLAVEQGAGAVYSDSLAALTTLKGWAGWGVARRLKCEDRAEVKAVLWKAAEGRLQRLEKVKAHRTDVAAKADPKALWNEKADAAAGRAADSGGVGTATCEELHEFEDVVQVRDGGGRWLRVVGKEVEECWWEKQKGAVVTRRPETLGKMFPPGVKIWWKVSNRMFGRPTVKGEAWIEAAAPGVVKWVARARVGALATKERLSKTGTVKGPDGQPAETECECCGAAVENDVHILTGCPETGTDKVAG